MIYIGIGICTVAVIAVGIVIFLQKENKDRSGTAATFTDESCSIEASESTIATAEDSSVDLIINVEKVPAGLIEDENNLVEITDNTVLARVDSVLPGFVQAGNVAHNAAQAVRTANEGDLYRAIIPAGAKLEDSKAMEGAVRGFYKETNRIKGNANWLPVETQTSMAVVTNTAIAAMSVASMVVGQYYMTQINTELVAINDGVSQIHNFQDNEYRSKVFSLIAHVKRVSDFQAEILENYELRTSKITQLDDLEEKCTELLGQANLTLEDFAKKTNLDYDSYEKAVGTAQKWFQYQKFLFVVLCKIADLRYALHLGSVSREQCNALISTYKQQVVDSQEKLAAWHKDSTKKLKIDTKGTRRKRAGVDGAVHFVPGLFNDNYNFRSIEKKTANMINAQVSGHDELLLSADKTELYSEDVQLFFKDGRVFYLPESKSE